MDLVPHLPRNGGSHRGSQGFSTQPRHDPGDAQGGQGLRCFVDGFLHQAVLQAGPDWLGRSPWMWQQTDVEECQVSVHGPVSSVLLAVTWLGPLLRTRLYLHLTLPSPTHSVSPHLSLCPFGQCPSHLLSLHPTRPRVQPAAEPGMAELVWVPVAL